MKISEVIEKLEPEVLSIGDDCEVTGCYIGDLLSLAMSNVQEGNIWITVQTNINTVAVSTLTEAGAIILPCGLKPDTNTLEKAKSENIYLLSSDKSAYELAKMLSELNI